MDTQQPKSLKVLLIGDSCTDIYHYGSCARLSPEAPVPVLKLSRSEEKPGMALNVKKNLESFSIVVDCLTNDRSITKERFIDIKSKNHLLRFDTGEDTALPPLSSEKITSVDFSRYDAAIVVDYNKGFLNEENTKLLSKLCHQHDLLFFIDSKKTNLKSYNHSIIKINELENSLVSGFPSEYVLIVTAGEKGAYYQNKWIKSQAVGIYDVCGAGDTFFAALIYKYLLTKNFMDSIKFANNCARITVMKSGVYALNEDDIKNANLCF